MKKIFTFLAILLATMSFGQTISQWNFDNPTPATAMLPTIGSGTFQTIGDVVDNLSTTVLGFVSGGEIEAEMFNPPLNLN